MSSLSPHSYDYLDDIPDSLYETVVTLGVGELAQRCQSLLYWRNSLLKGQLPRLFSWPANPDYQKIINALESANKYSLCLHNTELTDYYCLQILLFLDSDKKELVLLLPNEEDPSLSQPQSPPENSPNSENNSNQEQTKISKPEVLSTVKEKAASSQIPESKTENESQSFEQNIDEQNPLKSDLANFFNDYAIERRLGFDLTKGQFKRQAWKEILHCHKTIKHSAWLQRVIQQLGRNKNVKAKEGDGKKIYLSSAAINRQLSSHRSNKATMEMSGVERNDDVARMLPSELSMLGHPKLKMLWHSRRAERMLLSYKVDGVLSEHIPVCDPIKVSEQSSSKHRDQQKGPVIVILDTSASMKGEPEHLAKSIVLETLRVCRQQKRLCYLFLFSALDDVQQIELDGTQQSWLKILDLMQYSFHGGTQIEPVMNQAMSLLQTKKWRQADILLLSDGRFSLDDEFQNNINVMRQQHGLNCQGINVGAWQKHAMYDLCDTVYDYPHLTTRKF